MISMHIELSILICAHNEATYIEKTLSTLKAQECDFPFEIVLVDNASTDNTAEISRPYIQALCHCTTRGKIPSLCKGLQRCSAQIIAIADADTDYHPKWIQQIMDEFKRNENTCLVYGPTYAGETQTCLQSLASSAFARFSLAVGVATSVGFNMAVRSETLRPILCDAPPFAFSGWGIGTAILRRYGRESVKYSSNLAVEKCTRRINSTGIGPSTIRWAREWWRLARGQELAVMEGEYYGFDITKPQ